MGGFLMENQKMFSIGEFSKKTGISIRNLRYYDEIGLLVPNKHPTSGHRIYNYDDIITLQKIITLKFLGYSLDQITEMLQQSSFTVDLNETLSLHLRALEEEKEIIEKSMNTIKRVIHLLKKEGEVDSDLLFSLIHDLPSQHVLKVWMERHELSDVLECISKKSEEEKIALDQTLVQMSKKVKQLFGKSVEDPEVQEMAEMYIEATFSFLGEDMVQKLADVEMEEQEIRELEEMTPTPFTDQEQKWLLQAIEFYMEQEEIWEKNQAPKEIHED
jgi:DNA-binding transcriptional MerR regulator